MRTVFEVEQAGCESCGKVIASALGSVGTVESVDIDEGADTARVVLSGVTSRAAVDASLEEASSRGGHAYRVRTDSWEALA